MSSQTTATTIALPTAPAAPRTAPTPPPPTAPAPPVPGDNTEFPIPISADYPAAAPGLVPGQVIRERYRVGERIGGGGMADVFCAHDGWLRRSVAIKVIKPALASREMCRRMEQEGRAVAAIDHPNLLRVLDIGTLERTVYLVTELLHGSSLGDMLRDRPDGRLPWRTALGLLIPALDALHDVHKIGYVHRDLKPDNLYFHRDDRGDRLIVLDLGIAKMEPELRPDKVPYHTETGRVLGTPAYMSPEQASGLPVDRRADIYSLGVTLHRMLAGRLPFEPEPGDQPFQLMTRNLYDEPPRLDEQALGLPPGLADLVLRMLAKSPGQRPAHMRELAGALEDCVVAGQNPTLPTGSCGRGWMLRIAGIGASMALLGVLMLSMGESSSAEHTPPIPAGDSDALSAPAPATNPVIPAQPDPISTPPEPTNQPASVGPAIDDSSAPTTPTKPTPRRTSAVQAVFATAAREVASCLRRYGDADQHQLRVRLALAGDGSVTRAALVGTDLTLLGRCVQPTLRGLRFASGPAQELEHRYSRHDS